MKPEVKARNQLKRFMGRYEAAQQSVSSAYLKTQNGNRTPTPLPTEDEGYNQCLAEESSIFYSTEPLTPLQSDPSISSTVSTNPRKKNFHFFKWTAASRKSSSSSSNPTSDASLSPVSLGSDEVINTISVTPRVDIDLDSPRLSLTPIFKPEADRVRSMSASGASLSQESATSHSQYSTAPNSTTASGSSSSSAILSQKPSNDTLRSAFTLSRLHFSGAGNTDVISRFSTDSDDNRGTPKSPTHFARTVALLGAAGSVSANKRKKGTSIFSNKSSQARRPVTSSSTSVTSQRRRHSISSEYSLALSAGSSKLSTESRRAKVRGPPKTRAGNEDAFASMFFGPPPKKKTAPKSSPSPKTPSSETVAAARVSQGERRVEKSEEGAVIKGMAAVQVQGPQGNRRVEKSEEGAVVKRMAAVQVQEPQGDRRVQKPKEDVVLKEIEHPKRALSLQVPRVPQVMTGPALQIPASNLPLPSESQPSPSGTYFDPEHDALPSPPSSILLDAFMSLLEEYSSAPKLFSFSRPRAPSAGSMRSSRQGRLIRQGSFISTNPSVNETITEEQSPTKTTYVSAITTPYSTTDDEDYDAHDSGAFSDSAEKASFIYEKQRLESVVWFLSASKWLSFGRLLFSPGHHLLCMGQTDIQDIGIDDMRILDLDGPALAGWSWHLAYEYPSALVYNITTSKRYFQNYGVRHMQPLNHRLVLTESLTSLRPLESDSFDVITARALPRVLKKHEWIPLLKECYRVLKPDGYIELTIVDTVLNNMGPITKAWIEQNIIEPALAMGGSRNIDLHPSRSILQNLEAANLVDVHKCWVWVPAGSIGDELSSVTSRVGRYFYNDLFGNWGLDASDPSEPDFKAHHELELWNDRRVQKECEKENTAFRWLKCHARKGNYPRSVATASC